MLVGFASGDWVNPRQTADKKERWGGSGWARIGQYLGHLPFQHVHGVLIWNVDRFEIADENDQFHDPDVIVMQRLMHDGIADNIKIAKSNGQKIVNDLDDWYWGLSTSNNAFKANHPKLNPRENFNHYRATLCQSDVVMVSTAYLRDRIAPSIRGELILTPNTVDLSKFTPREHAQTDPVTVGWVGSTSHRSGDLETVKGILAPMAKAGTIRLFHGGHHPDQPSFASRLGLPDDMVDTLPICPHDEYPGLMQMDMGIVPLADLPFNRAKSYIKGLEYAAAGVPFVAQDMDAYVELAQDMGVGRIARKPKDWIRHIDMLRDPDIRAKEAELNRERISTCDIAYGVARMVDVLTNL